MKTKYPITIIGTGAYGTALANILANNHHQITMYGIEQSQIDDINNHHQNTAFFKDLRINSTIRATLNLTTAVAKCQFIIFAVPSHTLNSIIKDLNQILTHPVKWILASKGFNFHAQTIKQLFWSQNLIKTIKPNLIQDYGGIYGPSIANEMARFKNSALTATAHSLKFASVIKKLFVNSCLTIQTSDDWISCDIFAGIKNIVAVLSGIYQASYNTDSGAALLITIAVKQIQRFCIEMGGEFTSITNFAALADLILTASSPKSRNFSFGYQLFNNKQIELSESDIKKSLKKFRLTVEGYKNCQLFNQIADPQKNYPYLTCIIACYHILFLGKNPKKTIQKWVLANT